MRSKTCQLLLVCQVVLTSCTTAMPNAATQTQADNTPALSKTKDTDTSSEQKVKSLIDQAEGMNQSEWMAYQYYKQAYDLAAEDNLYKPYLITKLLISTTSPATSEQTSELRTKQRDESLRAAKLADQAKLPDASQYWLRLACFEARDGLTEAAIEHGKIAIERFDKHDLIARHISQILPAYGLVFILTQSKQEKEANLLMQLAVNKVKSTFGDQSLEYQAQLLQLFEFYVNQKRYDEAANCVDAIAACKDTGPSAEHDYPKSNGNPLFAQLMRKNDPPDAIFWGNDFLRDREQIAGEIRKCAFKTIQDRDCTFAVSILDKLIALDPLKERVEETKGHAYFLAHQYEEAAKIHKPIYNNRYNAAGREYIQCMEALGKKDEIARVLKEEAQKNLDFQKAHPPEIVR